VPCTDVSSDPFFKISRTILTYLQRVRDLVLRGELGPEACCSYGVCIKDVNVEGGIMELAR
jgi:hypothetical protein